MATVTGFTAEHMQDIEDATIVSAAVVGGHLILTRHDTTQQDAGSVAGPTGATGPTGPTSIAVVTSSTRPTGGSLFTGLAIYETDTKRFYIYDGAAWIYRGGVWLCTNATRPTSPFTGLQIYETDTKKPFFYNGSSWIYTGGSIICTSSTRPSSPFAGLPIYETDTNREYTYDGSNWIQKSGPPNWVSPSLLNSWVNFGSGLQNARHCLIDGLVSIQGTVKNGVMSNPVFVLPAGSRPAATLQFPVMEGANGIGRVDVGSNGNVTPLIGTNPFISLNLTFRVD